jgi:anthranilate phosphoribosyltransferase
LLGVFSEAWLEPLTLVLKELGSQKVWTVHGSDGLDEITTTGPTRIWEVRPEGVAEWDLEPLDLGIARSEPGALRGGDADANARAVEEVLAGGAGPARDVVALNAAAAIYAVGLAPDLAGALALAGESIDSGRALAALDALVEVSNRP